MVYAALPLSRSRPALLELEAQNEWEGQREPLYYLGIADKRYALYNLVLDPNGPIERDGKRYSVRIRKFSGHGLGVYRGRDGYIPPDWIPDPCDNEVKKCGPRWCYDLWHDAIVALRDRALSQWKTAATP